MKYWSIVRQPRERLNFEYMCISHTDNIYINNTSYIYATTSSILSIISINFFWITLKFIDHFLYK